MPAYDIPKAAPDPLVLVQRFVNTADVEHEVEWIATPAELERWLRENGHGVTRVTRADLVRALELREALRAILLANNLGGSPAAADLAVLNRFANELRVAIAPDGTRIDVNARAPRVERALAAIVAAVFRGKLDGTFDRLKVCRNCRWAFYDYSRNRRASWCSMSLCGNRLKTRRYRERQS